MHQSLVLVLTDPSRDNIETKAKINNFLSGTRGQEHELVALVQNVLAQPQPFRLLRRLVVDTENNKNRLQFASILFDCCLERLQVDEALDRIEADDLLDLLSVLQPQLMQAKIATLIYGISQVKPGDISRLRFLGKTLSAVGNGSFFKHWKLGWQTVWSLPFFEAKQRSMVSHYASIFLPEDVAANLELEALGVEGNANVRSALLDGTTKARLFSIRPRGLDKMQKSDTFLMHGKLKTRLMFIALRDPSSMVRKKALSICHQMVVNNNQTKNDTAWLQFLLRKTSDVDASVRLAAWNGVSELISFGTRMADSTQIVHCFKTASCDQKDKVQRAAENAFAKAVVASSEPWSLLDGGITPTSEDNINRPIREQLVTIDHRALLGQMLC